MDRTALTELYYRASLYIGSSFLLLGIVFYFITNSIGPLIAAILTGPTLIYLSIAHRKGRQSGTSKRDSSSSINHHKLP
jgi:hypothetical protein